MRICQKQTAHTVSLALCGSGGSGVVTAAQMILDISTHSGWYGLMRRSAGPQIRGGESAAMLRLAAGPICCLDDVNHLLLALDWKNFERFADEIPLNKNAIVVCDAGAGEVPDCISDTKAHIISIDLKKMARQIEGGRTNMIGLGIIAGVIGLPCVSIAESIERALSHKGEAAVEAAGAGIAAGLDLARKNELLDERIKLPRTSTSGGLRWNISGNEACGLGALRGGVRFVAAYPITPASELLEWITPRIEQLGGSLLQAEDELASINMVIGGSYGGVPSLTATSGPGLALMSEGIGLAVASEIPAVIIDVMRGGPSTGIPTKSEQSDLNIALYGLHGDAPHLVLAPTSIADCVFTTQWSVHLAELLQCPAIVLSDQVLGQSRTAIDKPAEVAFMSQRQTRAKTGDVYHRYLDTDSGISPMAIPGTVGCQFTAEGLEHSESGIPSSQSFDHQHQLDKRQRKLEQFDYGSSWAEIDGSGDTAVITWGSVSGAAHEAVARARNDGLHVRLIAVRLLAPAQPGQMEQALRDVKRILVIEQNHSAQFYHYLLAYYDLPVDRHVFAKPAPLTISPGEILQQIQQACHSQTNPFEQQ